MPYNPSTGVYSLPPIYLAIPGTVIIAAQHNDPLEDLETANNYARPIIAGGTGGNNITLAATNLEVVSYGSIQSLSDAEAAQARENIHARGGAEYRQEAGNYTIVAADDGAAIQFTSTATASFDPVADLGSAFSVSIWAAFGATVTLDPDGSETINGSATLILQPGQKADVCVSGSNLVAKVTSDSLAGPQLRGYTFGLTLTTNGSDATNDVDIAAGAAASDTTPFYLMQLASALTKRIDAAWAVGTNQGGLDTGVVGNNTYYIWLIQRSDTLVTDALFSLSNTAPTMPANYDRKRLIGYLYRASAANSAPIPQTGIFATYFESAPQTISASGLLTLAHGLGVPPRLVAPVLVCVGTEFNYAVGDIIPMPQSLATATLNNFGASIDFHDSTNILVRFGSSANVFIYPNKTTGNAENLTNANWRLRMRAWP